MDETVGLRSDQTIKPRSLKSRRDCHDPLLRSSYIDPESGESFVFLANCFAPEARPIAQIYRRCRGTELFWRWIKQHPRLRGFSSNSSNGVRMQIWSALCAYLLMAIAQHNKPLDSSLYEVLQIGSVSSLEQASPEELPMKPDATSPSIDTHKTM